MTGNFSGNQVYTIFDGALSTTPVTNAINIPSVAKTFQATITGSGALVCTIDIECSNDGENWLTLGTISLNGTDTDTDGFASVAPWYWHRASFTALVYGGDAPVVSVKVGT